MTGNTELLATSQSDQVTPEAVMLKLGESTQALSLLVVVVNYRTANLTIDCLKSLVEEVRSLPGTQVVVTDNCSGDDSVTTLAAAIAENHWDDWATLLPLEKNGGFAYGNNAAIRPLMEVDQLPPYVLLLNPDTVICPGALTHLLDFMNQHPEVGIAGSRLQEPDATPQRSAFRFPTVLSELENSTRIGLVSQLLSQWIVAPPVSDVACQTDWVAGASMIIRKAVFDAIGLMDEGYFMYFEEVDFCLRANRAGWPCWYVPASRVVHLVGQSSGVTDTKRPPKRLPTYWFDSRRRYFLKNHGLLYTVLADLLWMLGFTVWETRKLLGQPHNDPPQQFTDFVVNSVFFKGGHV